VRSVALAALAAPVALTFGRGVGLVSLAREWLAPRGAEDRAG
jgi:hypothetical protein